MKTAIALGILFFIQQAGASGIQFYNQIELPANVRNVQLVDAEYVILPTKTMTREIPNCNSGGEAGRVCSETVVLESAPAIRANISYVDPMFMDEGGKPQYTSVVLELTNFSNQQVSVLMSVYPGWKHPFSTIQRDFARNHLNLSVAGTSKTIQIVDMKRSKICRVFGESGEPERNCVEDLVYKNAQTKVLLLTVNQK